MFIHEMSEFECEKALEEATLGRLACVCRNQPYVVPVYFAFDGKYIYGFTTLGQKVDWMRTNPQVCVEIDECKRHDQWMSVIVFGRYEELPDQPEFEAARAAAYKLLQRRISWWEPAYIAREHCDLPHSLTPIFYRIHIQQMTGHRATPDKQDTFIESSGVSPHKHKWFGKLFDRFGTKDQHLHPQ